MKKEDLQNSQQRTGSAENKGESRDQQKNQITNVPNDQQNDFTYQTGLGRDRMADVEDLGMTSGREDYSGDDNDDVDNQNTNQSIGR